MFAGGALAQLASPRRMAALAMDHNGRSPCSTEEAQVVWVFLEILAALAIAVAIVWWTFPKKPAAQDKEGKERDDDTRGG